MRNNLSCGSAWKSSLCPHPVVSPNDSQARKQPDSVTVQHTAMVQYIVFTQMVPQVWHLAW